MGLPEFMGISLIFTGLPNVGFVFFETCWSRWRACSQMLTNRRTMSWRPACWGWIADVWLKYLLKHKQTEEVKLRCYSYLGYAVMSCVILRYLNNFLHEVWGLQFWNIPPDMNYKIYEALLENDKRCFHMIPTSHFNLMFPLWREFLWSRH